MGKRPCGGAGGEKDSGEGPIGGENKGGKKKRERRADAELKRGNQVRKVGDLRSRGQRGGMVGGVDLTCRVKVNKGMVWGKKSTLGRETNNGELSH